MNSQLGRLLLMPLAGFALTSQPVSAQVGGDGHHTHPAVAGGTALERHHLEVAKLLASFEVAHLELYERLLAEPNVPPERLEGDFFESVLAAAHSAKAGEARSERPAAQNLAQAAPRLKAIMDRTYALQRQIYEIYSDEGVTDKRVAVDQEIDAYLAQPAAALAAVPKSMEIMEQQHGSLVFRQRYPKTAGLFWALRWLQMGASEPLIVYRSVHEQHGAVSNTIARFEEILSDAPENFPSHMPMAPTIAPELVTRSLRAAAILDNLNMMHDVVVDILVNERVTDKPAAIEEAINLFSDPAYLAIQEIDWIRMSLRHGIFAQGGPAIGRLERPERNDGGHANHGEGGGTTRMRPPGM